MVAPAARASILADGLTEHLQQHDNPPYPVVDGIAVIEIAGVLIHRGGWIGQSSGQTSYEGIAAQIEAAASDPAVRGIALEIDSFGGEVAGIFDLADRIRAIRGSKHVGPLSLNMPFRQAMRWLPRPSASSCPAPAPLAASVWW